MDFKDRFKGRTSTISKEGVINNLNAPSTNPVQKSFSNNQLSARSKAPTPLSHNDNQPSLTYQRNSIEQGLEKNRGGPMPGVLPPHSYSKSPVSRNTFSNNPSRLPTGSVSVTPSKNPYFVQNPFPSLEQMERQYANYDYASGSYGRLDQQPNPMQGNIYQSLPNTQFNPNSFYNQHSQYKVNPAEPVPKRENIERQANYGGFNPTQLAKKNFEVLSQQNKQKRSGDDGSKGFDSPNLAANRYADYQHMPSPGQYPVHNNTDFAYRPPPHMPLYQGQRDIHSNPSPHQQMYTNPFTYYPSNASQFGREPHFEGSPMNRQPPSSSPDAGKKATPIQNSTNYKPYNLQDYKDVKVKASVKLGGLGANTNTDEWYTQKEKRDKMIEFSQNVKMFNMQRLPATETGFKPRKEKEKERSRRDVALEFAKNVPKPKHRRDSSPVREDEEERSQILRAKRSESDMPVHHSHHHYSPMEDLDTYEQRHNFFAAQLNKMKSDK